MEKFIIVAKSGNRITGPIMVTTSPRATCPLACPLRGNADSPERGVCYAEHGYLGRYIWTGLDQTPVGASIAGRTPVRSFDELLEAVSALPPGTMWRHNQAGDLPSRDNRTIDDVSLRRLVDANRGRRGFTYTHFDVVDNLHNRAAIKDANNTGFTINLSANSLREADALAASACAPVTVVVGADRYENTETPGGHKVVVCPARIRQGVTCSNCGLCARQRQAIISFPALGARKSRKLD